MTDMRKKNHLTFRDDLSMFDNFFQSSWMLVERKRLVNGIWFINFIDVCHGIDSRSFSYEYPGHVSLYLA